MPLVTLFIIPGDERPDVEETIRSFGKNLIRNVVVTGTRSPDFTQALAPYFAYMYSDEVMSLELRLALPHFFANSGWDALVLFRHNVNPTAYFYAPRIFRSTVVMDGLVPKYPRFVIFEKALNGCLRNQHVNFQYSSNTRA